MGARIDEYDFKIKRLRLTLPGRQKTDCSETNLSTNSNSVANSGNLSISIPTYSYNAQKDLIEILIGHGLQMLVFKNFSTIIYIAPLGLTG